MKETAEKLGEAKALLEEWKKWADMGLEEYVPDWAKPVLDSTYERTREFLQKP